MKFFYIGVSVLSIFLAGIIWGVWDFLVAEHIAETHFTATRFSVFALIFSIVVSGALVCGSVALTSRKNVAYTMTFPWTLALWMLSALVCVPLSALVFETCVPTTLVHACALFAVVFLTFSLLTAASVGERKDYEIGRRRVFSLREDFCLLNELIVEKNVSPCVRKLSETLADDFSYVQESIPASETLDAELEEKIGRLKTVVESANDFDEAQVVPALSAIRSLVARRERFIKQNR